MLLLKSHGEKGKHKQLSSLKHFPVEEKTELMKATILLQKTYESECNNGNNFQSTRTNHQKTMAIVFGVFNVHVAEVFL